MQHESSDTNDGLHVALAAMQEGREADAITALETLLETDAGHVYGRYLLAAQHAQLGQLDRAEAGFREVVTDTPGFAIARFQLGQLLLVRGYRDQASSVMQSLSVQADAIAAYARALLAVEPREAIMELAVGLSLPQPVPALMADMQRLHEKLMHLAAQDDRKNPMPVTTMPARVLASYGKN